MQRRALLRSVAGGCGVGVGLGLGLGLSSGSAIASAAQESYEPLGSVPVDGACEVVVGDDQETAYLATVDGFATVDVSDPADPQVLPTDEASSRTSRTRTARSPRSSTSRLAATA
ncbi:hypothetical protein ACFQMM_06225 [Saliphagus sp. GCM10025308]